MEGHTYDWQDERDRMDSNLHKKATVLDRAVTLNWWFCVDDNWKAIHAAREGNH